MKKQSILLRRLTVAAMVAAMYTALTLSMTYSSYGVIQFRVSEMLTIFPVFTAASIPGLAVGCALSNLLGLYLGVNPAGVWDVLIGSMTTLSAAMLTYSLRNVRWFKLPVAATLPPVILNAVIIGAELTMTIFDAPRPASMFAINMLQVGVGQLVSCTAGGLLLYAALERARFRRVLQPR